MAIAFDTVTASNSGSATTLTYAHTVASGGSLIVGTGTRDAAVSSVTYDGTTMSESAVSGDFTTRIFDLANPTTGSSANVVVTMASTSRISSGAISVTGADTTNLIGASHFSDVGSNNAYNVSVTTTNDNSMLVSNVVNACIGSFSGGQTNETERVDQNPGSNHSHRMTTRPVGTAGSYAVSGSVTCTNDIRVFVVEVNEPTVTNYTVTTSDSISLAGTTVPSGTFAVLFSDSITASDAVTALIIKIIRAVDSLSLSASRQIRSSFSYSLSDIVSASESWLFHNSLSVLNVLSVTTAESTSFIAHYKETFVDAVKVTLAYSEKGWSFAAKHVTNWTFGNKNSTSWTFGDKHDT